jgi:hypothetical protein
MEQYGRQKVAGLMIEFNSQKYWYVSRCCGRKFAEKSAAYVSAARVVSRPKFIAHFFCKSVNDSQKT